MRPRLEDDDRAQVRRAARAVALQLTLAAGILVLVVLGAALVFVLSHLDPAHVDRKHLEESTIDVGADDILLAGGAIGLVAVIVAGGLSWVATRRAVRPLSDALRLERSFVANASHELRTPLAVVDARLQYLQRHLPIGDPSATTVDRLRSDTATLAEIVSDLLHAAEGRSASPARPHPVGATVQRAVESMRLLGAERGIRIEYSADGEHAVEIAPNDLHRSVVALLDNALRFAPDGSAVTVRLNGQGRTVQLSIRDEGPGIRGIDPRDVFRRFARGSDATRGTRGAGIGLALVKDAVVRAGGSVSIDETGPSGTVFRLVLPVASGAGSGPLEAETR